MKVQNQKQGATPQLEDGLKQVLSRTVSCRLCAGPTYHSTGQGQGPRENPQPGHPLPVVPVQQRPTPDGRTRVHPGLLPLRVCLRGAEADHQQEAPTATDQTCTPTRSLDMEVCFARLPISSWLIPRLVLSTMMKRLASQTPRPHLRKTYPRSGPYELNKRKAWLLASLVDPAVENLATKPRYIVASVPNFSQCTNP